MKLFGRVKVPFSNSKLTRDEVLSRFLPGYQPGAEGASPGLSGGSCIIENPAQRLVLRQHHDLSAPAFHFLRHYHALKHLPGDLAPRPVFCTQGWMATEYFVGEVRPDLPSPEPLARLLHRLHRQSPFGWRIAILPLLAHYWLHCAPARRTPFWLRQLKMLKKQGEPRPLRLAPLHMDIHAGNIIVTAQGLRLIDWEYAGDGDIALELAAVWVSSDAERQQLVEEYATQAKITPSVLWRQVQRWLPWVDMLKVTWYEYRWQQSGDRQFITLAEETWCQLRNKG